MNEELGRHRGREGKFGQNGMSGQKGKVHFRSKCKQLRPLPWVRGQWQWSYGSNMGIVIIIIDSVDYK